MKKDISVIRDSIVKIVALLTNRSIKVTQRGARAFVQYHSKTGAIQLVNIPYLPDDASDEFVAAVQGFLDHEVGHVMFTDSKVIPLLRKESAKVKNLANAIEDVYIERKMSEAFRGSIGNLNSVRRFYLDKIAKPKIEEALAAGDMNAAAGYASLVQFRAWGGQQVAADFLTDNPSYAKLVAPIAEKLGEDLIAKIKKANSSKECLGLAKSMCEKLDEPKPPAPESDDGADDADTSSPGKSDESDETPEDAPDTDEKSEPEDAGTSKTETDDSDKEREEESKSDTEGESEAGEDGGEDEGEREESSEDDKSEKDPEKEDEVDGESDSPESADDEETDPPESEEPEDGLSIAEEGGDDAGEDSEGDEDAEGEGAEDEDGETDSSSHGTEDGMKEPELDPFAEERDFDKDMSEALTKAAITEISESDYQIFSTDWDEIEPAPMSERADSIEKMVDKTQHMIASIQKTLERAISAKARKTWNPGQRRGRIAPGSLFRTALGDDRVFRQRYETHAKNTAVSLLVDCSGSMGWGGKIEVAGHAAFALSSTLERLKVPHEVIGFTSREAGAMKSAMKSESAGVGYARNQSIYMPVFKGFGERLGTDARSRMAHLTERECHYWLKENIDGECLMIAAHRLKIQRAERHVLIVLSDGSPACPGDYHQLRAHLKKVAKDLNADSGVEVIGVGIQDNSVSSFYEKYVVLNDLDELPTTLISQLAKVLLAN